MSTLERATLSVIVPVGPGDVSWRALLPDLAALPDRAEIVLVATSDDCATGVCARACDQHTRTRWIQAPAGRAAQQNAGAAQARGDVLWFVHADSRVTVATLAALDRYLAAPHGLGYFDLRFLGDGPLAMRLNTLGAWVRSRWLRLPFGDQGFVLRAADFARLGGFDAQVGYGEDHALVWQARRRRIPLRALAAPLYTSARKYAEHGWWRTTAHHLLHTVAQAWRFARAPLPPQTPSQCDGNCDLARAGATPTVAPPRQHIAAPTPLHRP